MKVAVLLSGGVDSSVALRLLQEDGRHDITAFYLKIWLEDEVRFLGNCPWQEDLDYARAVCEQAGVPLRIVPLQREYYERVVGYALAELRAGRTPSPDIFCNRRIKFGLFPERIESEFERIASGHYAVVKRMGGGVVLARSPDPVKDQTYFLSHQTREQIERSMFPIGGYRKTEVRRLAEELALPNRNRKDSQGICFLGKIRYPDFVRHYLGERKGEIRDRETGRVLGEHDGYWFYTIGQRQGLGLGNGPWYVSGKNVDTNIVYVTHGERIDEATYASLLLSELHWINGPPGRADLSVKLRHGPELQDCRVSPTADGGLRVSLERPDRGIAPGQFGVLYDGEVCLGGGKIVGPVDHPS